MGLSYFSNRNSNTYSFKRKQAHNIERIAVIQIWMWGGPSHLDTFDPKPEAGYDYCGPLNKPIETNVAGIRICELLPVLAKQADKYSIIRSMTHGNNGHETASYMVQTGRQPGGRRSIRASAPWCRCSRATTPVTRAGSALHRVDPAAGPVLRSRVPGLALQALRHRRRPRADPLRRRRHRRPGHLPISASATAATCSTSSTRWSSPCRAIRDWRPSTKCEKQAYDLILGDAGKVFDLSQEKDDAARPVRPQHLRPVLPRGRGGWSSAACPTSPSTTGAGIRTSRISRPCAASCRRWTKAWRPCLQDLSDRGLLDSTIVWWGGEFGRTPKVQWEAALERRTRPLWPRSSPPWSPAADSRAATSSARPTPKAKRCKERPVYPVRPDRQHVRTAGHRHRRQAAASPGTGRSRHADGRRRRASGGRLKEIM